MFNWLHEFTHTKPYVGFVLLIALILCPPVLAEQLRDPTRPLMYKAKSAAVALILQAILDKNNKKQAVINGKILNVGESYKSHKIIKISANTVLMTIDGTTKILNLRPKLIKVSGK